MKKSRIQLRLLVGLFLMASLSMGAAHRPKTQALNFQLPVLSEAPSQMNFAELNESHPVLLVFWATWCPSCIEEIPVLNELQALYADKGLKIIGINVEEAEEVVAQFQTRHTMEYPVVLDTNGDVANKYGIVALPSSIFVAKGGEVLYYGFTLPSDIGELLEKQEALSR